VCFRFWKNGKQVDHLREVFPPSDPIDASLQESFAAQVTQLEVLKEQLAPNARPQQLNTTH
jgi:hypothetical protein